MQEITITHNPYVVDTEILVDDIPLKTEGYLNNIKNQRLHLWIHRLFEELINQINSKSFNVIFKGRQIDYEDIKMYKDKFCYENEAEIELSFKELFDEAGKLKQLKKLFKKIQEGPYEDLKSDSIKKAFNEAVNDEFEVSVLATMSSGKSTLINAMLGEELLPSKNEACTATIAKIKDIDEMKYFRCRSLNNERELVKDWSNADSELLKKYNEDENISHIEIEGDVPHISDANMNLVLIDTPGPNNSKNEHHREETFRHIKSEYPSMILYVLNGTGLETDDDSNFLKEIAEAMRYGGKIVADRFLFVVNKMDCFDPDTEDINDAFNKVVKYLNRHGIKNPKIFPTSAELAKVLRLYLNEKKLTNLQKRTKNIYDMFFEYSELDFIQQSSLSEVTKSKLRKQMEQTDNDYEKALYLTGVPSIEASINEFLEKYAIPFKIKNAIEAFEKELEEKNIEKNTLQMISESEEERKEIIKNIDEIENKLNKKGKVEKLKKKIDSVYPDFDKLDAVRTPYTKTILNFRDKYKNRGGFASRAECEQQNEKLINDLKDIEHKINLELENKIKHLTENEIDSIIQEFQDFANTIIGDISIESPISKIVFNSLKINKKNLIETKPYEYETTEEVEVERSKWNPKRWFGNKYRIEEEVVTKTGKKYKVDIEKLIQPLNKVEAENFEKAQGKLKEYIDKLKDQAKDKIDEIQKELDKKMEDLNILANDKQRLNKIIHENKKNYEWLNDAITELKKIKGEEV